MVPPVGVEPTLYTLEECCAIHYTTEAKMAQAGGIEPTAARVWSSAD